MRRLAWFAAPFALLAAQTPEPTLAIEAPTADTYVSGATVLRANVEPPDGAATLTFFVDGRQACVLKSPPWQCDWDAGARIAEHQVRAVATLKDGARLVRTVRTKTVGYTERVNV